MPTPARYTLYRPQSFLDIERWARDLPFPREIDWTPVIKQGGSSLDYIADRKEGWLAGQWVELDLMAFLDDTGSAAQLQLHGLPYTPACDGVGADDGILGYGMFNYGGTPHALVAGWDDTNECVHFIRAGSYLALSVASGDYLSVHLRYRANIKDL